MIEFYNVDIVNVFYEALTVTFTPRGLTLVFLGTLFGLTIGFVPGTGGMVAIALLIPLTYGMDPIYAFLLLGAAKGGVNLGGSMTSILFNTPGAAPNAATLIDGFPMTQRGESGTAIGASAAASAVGALIGIVVLLLLLPVAIPYLMLFGAAEVFWLGLWGLLVVSLIVKGDFISGLISAGIGGLIALHGINTHTSTVRWDYGFTFLRDGFELIPIVIGLFAIGQMIQLMKEGTTLEKMSSDESPVQQKWQGIKSVFTNYSITVRSAIIGVLIGAIPGVGGTASTFIAYLHAKQTAGGSETFGEGDIRGVIAPEASNDAKDGGSLIPTLGLGIPGSGTTALLLAAFLFHGLTPGPRFLESNIDIFAIIVVALIISNVLSSVMGVLLAEHLSKVAAVRPELVASAVTIVGLLGVYTTRGNIYDIFVAGVFAVVGFVMIVNRMSRVPLLLALVLVPIIETNFFRALQISRQNYGIFFDSTISVLLVLLILVSLLHPILTPAIKRMINRGELLQP